MVGTCRAGAAQVVSRLPTEAVPLPSPPNPLLGRTLGGRYRIIDQIGEGGMGTVFRAEQLPLGREVAVKVLSVSLAANPAHIERFRREAAIISRLQHPNVVSLLVYDVDECGAPYIVMELLVGETLAARLARERMLEPRQSARLVGEIARGLEAAHDAGVVHRDLKPENIFLVRCSRGNGAVKLLDFGIGRPLAASAPRLTAVNSLIGRPAYMAPEQVPRP
jgi:serine/threonine protein kinase